MGVLAVRYMAGDGKGCHGSLQESRLARRSVGLYKAGTPRAMRQSRKNGHYSEEGGWSHPCLHGVQGALSAGRTPPRHLHSPSMTFRLWPSAILWAMLTSKQGLQPFPPKGQGQPTFHPRIESVPACLPVEGGAVAWLARWVFIQ